ncbi:MAG: FKBP-type peptidyl-prolyl cis-trans isomerase [Paludibacteraceae bacterium]|nr:FKBP-type peptidyl-prolyl cis-trans isomerase [Paludibacteraceae bacterium]
MKTIKTILLLLCVVALSSCQQNDWLDWKVQNELWLVQNAKADGVITTPTGLQYKCIYAGHDKSARPDDAKMVTIKYSGKLITGYEFDAAESYTGYVSSFVPGFIEGLKKMHEFGIFEFYIPYDLAYGEEGAGSEGTSSHIPPYSTLIFHVELKSVN